MKNKQHLFLKFLFFLFSVFSIKWVVVSFSGTSDSPSLSLSIQYLLSVYHTLGIIVTNSHSDFSR